MPKVPRMLPEQILAAVVMGIGAIGGIIVLIMGIK